MLLASCSEPTAPQAGSAEQPQSRQDTPIYLVDPIETSPQPVTAGKLITFSMKIENAGNVSGDYQADLLIDGKLSGHQSVNIPAHSTGSLVFQNVFAEPGEHSIKIGPQNSTVSISDSSETKPVSTLQLDNGTANGFDSLAGTTRYKFDDEPIVDGHMISLTAPTEGFVINSIDIFGYLRDSTYDFNNNKVMGGPGMWVYAPEADVAEPARSSFTVNIYDDHRTRLYSGDFDKKLFANYPHWVRLNTGPVRVAGDFKVEILTFNQPEIYGSSIYSKDYWHRYVVHTWYYQIMIGYEDSLNVRSYVSQSGNVVPEHYFTYNWLIRAVGHPDK